MRAHLPRRSSDPGTSGKSVLRSEDANVLALRTAIRSRRGATSLETGLVLFLSMLFLLAIFEYGRLLMMRNLVENAAREGARQAVVGTSSKTTANIQSTVTSYLAGQHLSNLNIQVYLTDSNGNQVAGSSWTSAQFGQGIGVQVDADYSAMCPTFHIVPSTIHISAKSVMLSEAE